MDYSNELKKIYNESFEINDYITEKELKYLELITENIDRSRWVYTVLVTLMLYKLYNPKQDIRYFQKKMDNWFSARSFDTMYITPTLKELWLPSMAESWWLTRSLEQPYPYTLDYQWEISWKWMKEAFLGIINIFENNNDRTLPLLKYILNKAIKYREENKIVITKIDNKWDMSISLIIKILDIHFNYNYKIHGGSKLPVIAFYAIYEFLNNEIWRYSKCRLWTLWSHTASDRTSKSAWDIELFEWDKTFEVVEVKLDKKVDINIARIAYEKIARFNPKRYYILSYYWIEDWDSEWIESLIKKVKNEHWCQLIVNWLLHTLKYYLRLIDSPKDFFNRYIKLVEEDKELQKIHKTKLGEIINELTLN